MAAPLTISSLRYGLNDTDPPSSLRDDACTIAENIEFGRSALGERRLGCTAVAQPTEFDALDAVTWMGWHRPSADVGAAELWALAQDLDTNVSHLSRRPAAGWSTVDNYTGAGGGTLALLTENGQGHRISAQSLHGKYFVASRNGFGELSITAKDRLIVWDGTTFRYTGARKQGHGISAANDGGVGTFSGTRYYRIRGVVLSGSTVLLRSEPFDTTTITPNGNDTGVIISHSFVAAFETPNITHLELEASIDNANFYRIATLVTGDFPYTDTVAYNTGYQATGTLSEDIGAYTDLPGCKFVSADDDRLIMGGSYENDDAKSRISWTPPKRATGVGNDERLDITRDPFLDLDGFEGGEMTGLSRSINGTLYATKESHIYKIVRTGDPNRAYEAYAMTKKRGAIEGSLIEAFDRLGNPAVYCLDQAIGPVRVSLAGLRVCGLDIQTLWARINLEATETVSHGVFDAEKNEVHWWIAVDGAEHPNMKIILNIDNTIDEGDVVRGGWTTVPVGDYLSNAHCSVMAAENVATTDPRSPTLRPVIGKEAFGSPVQDDYIQRCDVGNRDTGLADATSIYRGRGRTRPFMVSGLLNRHGIMACAVLAEALTAGVGESSEVTIKGIRDFGLEPLSKQVDLAPAGSEEHVIKVKDEFSFSELTALQIEFGDLDTNLTPSDWALNLMEFKLRGEQKA